MLCWVFLQDLNSVELSSTYVCNLHKKQVEAGSLFISQTKKRLNNLFSTNTGIIVLDSQMNQGS